MVGSWIPSPPCCFGALIIFQFTRCNVLLSSFPPSQKKILIYMPSWCKTYLGASRAGKWYKGMVDKTFSPIWSCPHYSTIYPRVHNLGFILSRTLFQALVVALLRYIGIHRQFKSFQSLMVLNPIISSIFLAFCDVIFEVWMRIFLSFVAPMLAIRNFSELYFKCLYITIKAHPNKMASSTN